MAPPATESGGGGGGEVVLQKSTPTQIRQLVLHYYGYKEQVFALAEPSHEYVSSGRLIHARCVPEWGRERSGSVPSVRAIPLAWGERHLTQKTL